MYGLRYLIERVYELKGYWRHARLRFSRLAVGVLLTASLGGYSQVSTAQTREIRVISSSTNSLDEQNTFIQSALTAVDQSLVFAGYCRVGDASPDPTQNKAWLAVESGTIFGKTVEELDFLVGNGSDFEVKTVDAISKGVVVMPDELSTSLSGTAHDYNSDNLGLSTTSGQVTNYAYSVIPGQQRDSISIVDEGNENYSVVSSGTSALLSAVYEKPGASTDPDRSELTVLNQRAGNNVKVINQPYIEIAIPAEPTDGFDFGMEGTYFVSSSGGNDSNDGLSPDRPKKTLAAVMGLVKNGVGGQKVALKASDVWEISSAWKPSKAGVSGNPITIGAYGVGQRPKIDCTMSIKDWTQHSGRIYKAKVTTSISQLFVDDERVSAARFPNTGWAEITSVGSASVVTSSELASGINYTGAAVIHRMTNYSFQNLKVVSSSGQTISTNTNFNNPTVGTGFILVNKLEFLDAPNEWYYDANSSTVYVWLADSSNPSGHEVRGTRGDHGINTSGSDNLVLENLEISGARVNGINILSNNLTVRNCDVHGCKYAGISAPASDKNGFYILNNIVSDCCNRGIEDGSGSSQNKVFSNNTIRKIGLYYQLNETSNWALGIGLSTSVSNATVEYNNIQQVGYNGINISAANSVCRYNYIESPLLTSTDGGGIYAAGNVRDITGLNIQYNIVRNAYGEFEGTGYPYSFAGCGIYLDESAKGVTVQDNVVENANFGIFFHKSIGCTLKNNLLFNTGLGIYIHTQPSTPCSVSGNEIVAFDSSDPSMPPYLSKDRQYMVMLNNGANPSVDQNAYMNAYDKQVFKVGGGGANIDFTTWKSQTNQDGSTTYKNSLSGVPSLLYNDTALPKVISLAGTYIDVNNNTLTSVILQPFTGVVVLKK